MQFGAGAGIGMLLGLIMGLSATPIVSTVLGAIAAGLLGLLGVGGRSSSQGSDDSRLHHGALRILGFGFACSVFVVVGILLRTHDALAPSLKVQEQELRSSGTLSKSDVRAILLLKAFGLREKSAGNGSGNLAVNGGKSIAGDTAPVLFVSPQDVCTVLRRDQYEDISSYVRSLQAHGGDFAKLGKAIDLASPEDQEKIASSLSDLLCK